MDREVPTDPLTFPEPELPTQTVSVIFLQSGQVFNPSFVDRSTEAGAITTAIVKDPYYCVACSFWGENNPPPLVSLHNTVYAYTVALPHLLREI